MIFRPLMLLLAMTAGSVSQSSREKPTVARPPDAGRVAVYRNDAGVKAESGAPRYARQMADTLDRLGVRYELIGDQEVAAGRLAGKKVAILPLNPVLPAPAAGEIRKFVSAGGQLLVCYRLPEPLGELLGVRAAGSIDGRDGRLEAIRFQGREDRPKITAVQQSWIALRVTPAEGTKVRGRWVDKDGKVTDLAAVTRNKHGYYVAHVLTARDQTAKDRLVAEMVGRLWPGAWKESYLRRLERLGKLAGLAGVRELTAAATRTAESPQRAKAIQNLLAEAGQLAGDARAAAKYGDYIVATELMGRAQDSYARAYASGVRSRRGEFRAVWCHDPAGVAGYTWERAVEALSDAGFNAIIVNMLWGGGAAYPSDVLPRVDAAGGADLLGRCLWAARQHRLAVHVWKVNWNLGWRCPEPFRRKMLQAGRLQQDVGGKTLGWLCPCDPENHTLELESMLEVVRRYPVAGVHFDYIRYPHGGACYCPRCRDRFEKEYKLTVADWPADAHSGGLQAKYRQFRRDNITRLVAAVSERARKLRPDILISAAVFWNWAAERDNIGQDWKLWIEKGYLDFVCPMLYTTDASTFRARLAATRGWVAGKVPLMPGIGATLGLDPAGTLQQVLIARAGGGAGFVLFEYNRRLAGEHLPLLGLGATSAKTAWAPPRRGKISGGSR